MVGISVTFIRVRRTLVQMLGKVILEYSDFEPYPALKGPTSGGVDDTSLFFLELHLKKGFRRPPQTVGDAHDAVDNFVGRLFGVVMLDVGRPVVLELVPNTPFVEPALQSVLDNVFRDYVVPHCCRNDDAVVCVLPKYLLE